MAYWAKTYEPGRAKAVAVDKNGDIIVAGVKKDGKGDGFVTRLDKDGNVKWFKTYDGDGWDNFNDVKIAPNGDIIVAGDTGSFGTVGRNVWVLRLDENGNVKWQKTYGGKYLDVAEAIAVAENGDIIVAGGTSSFGAGSWDVWVLRLDSNGNVKWQRTYGGSDYDYAEAVVVADNGDIIVAGFYGATEGSIFGSNNDKIWVLRLPPEGNLPDCDFCSNSNAQVIDTNSL